MAKRDLLIVESPTKARTISRFLKGDIVVESSNGHIRDLPEKDDAAVDVEHGYQPRYVIIPGKEKILQRLQSLASQAKTVWLATDEDREGEAIAWHLVEVLGLDPAKTKRIVFHEITKSAIERALRNPRGIDFNLVNAQQARRILDRLVGYELSPLLWRKVRGALSAGRVQSVAVRLIVEREREIEAFVPQEQYRVRGTFRTQDGHIIRAEMRERLSEVDSVRLLLDKLRGATFSIEAIESKPAKKSPSPPFTTSTLQQEASKQLGLPIAITMRLAQQLYEQGYITYMRTDSVSLSEEALEAAGSVIGEMFGKAYHQRRQYQTKVANAQEAHEAIRPTDFSRRTLDGVSKQEQQLYDLIWKRALASQMSDAQLERTIVTIAPSTVDERFVATGEVIVFDGFLRLYALAQEEDTEGENSETMLLPSMKVGELVEVEEIVARQTFTRPPARYTEASLVRKLEELGIGRPSTYATIIARIQERGYVERKSKEGVARPIQVLRLVGDQIVEATETETVGSERNKLFPTPVGALVTDFLLTHFPDVMDYQFTAHVEEQFDQIARGELQWQAMLDEFYRPFHAKVEHVLVSANKVGRRFVGIDPETGEEIFVGINRNQQLYVQRGDKFASLPPGTLLDSVTLEQARYYLQFPRLLGEYQGGPVLVAIGRGPYIEWRQGEERRFASVPPELDPLQLSLEQAIEILEKEDEQRAARQARSQPRVIGTTSDGQEVTVGIGRYGPYVRIGDDYASIDEELLETITVEQAVALLEEKQQQRILRRFEDNPDAAIVQGKSKPYLRIGSKIYWLPDQFDYSSATLQECLDNATPARTKRRQAVKRK
ncbi:MAG: type I DNA topoisomerase [Candidatus Kapabacteria bacterium]|nr:type I DNA topoisomerase [Candidatus Kapabacteria bacterium]